MPVTFGAGTSRNEQVSAGRQSSTQVQSGRTTGTSTSTRGIAGAGETENALLTELMNRMTEISDYAMNIGTNYASAEQEAIALFNRTIETGAKNAMSTVAKTGMNSSLINNMVGAATKGAADPLSQMLIGTRLAMPGQNVNTMLGAVQPLQSLMTNYFLAERSQNITQRGSEYGTQAGSSSTSGWSDSYQAGTQRNAEFGFSA